MLKLKTITMRNFLSVGNVTQAIHLDSDFLTLVLGNNLDSNNGASRNGAGKTTLIQALSFALYGQPLTKIKLDNLINNINQKAMHVTIDFSVGDRDYRIERGRKPNFLKFYVNGTEIIEDDAQGENRETQIDIVKLVGMSHNMFTHIVALNTYTTPFLKQRAADQRELTEELFGVRQISQRAETLKKLMGMTKESLVSEQARITAITNSNARINDAIDQAEKKLVHWQQQHDAHVDKLAEQIAELSTIDFDNEKRLFDELDAWIANQRDIVIKLDAIKSKRTSLKRDLDRIRSEMNKPVSNANEQFITRLQADRVRKEKQYETSLSDVGEAEEALVAKKTELENADHHSCATCAQPLAGTNHLATVKDNLQKQVSDFEGRVNQAKEIVRQLEDYLATAEKEISEATEKAATEKSAYDEAQQRNANKVADLTKQISDVDAEIEAAMDASVSDDEKPRPLFSSRDELYSTKQLLDSCHSDLERERMAQNPHVQHLESLMGTLQDISYDNIERLNSEMAHQDFLHKLLTNKDSFIRRKIIEQNLSYLNQRLSVYSEKLGLPHEVVFQSDLSVEIMQLGQDFDFDQLSRGEQLRVILSVSWAFRDVWESLNHPINLLWVDEMLDAGVDSSGAEAGLTVLKSMGRDRQKNVFLISHRDELIGRIDSIMLVSKQNGFTNVGEYEG